MKTIKLGPTDLVVSQIAYGCMEIGGTWDASPLANETRRAGLRAVRAALDEGINFFDHADIYCQGKSEEVFSALWQESPGLREQIIVQTKCGIRFAGDPHPNSPGRYDFSYEHILRSVEGSVRRLGTDYLDVLLLHRPDPLVEPDEVARAFDELHQSGKVRYFGVSNHTAAQIRLLKRSLTRPLVTNQVELNIVHAILFDEGVSFNQQNPPVPLRNEGTVEYCRAHKITLQAWAPLAGGILTGRPVDQPSPALQATRKVVAGLAAEKGVSGEAILIAWLLRHPSGIQPVIGTTRPERIRAACQGVGVDLSREEWYRLWVAGRGAELP